MFSYSGHVMTLANSIIGVGILAMPFCFQRCGILLSIVLLVLSNWITRVCCHYLIKTSLLTRRKSFEMLGLHAFGSSGKLLAELCIIGYLIGTCITYFVVVGDLGPQIIEKLFAIDAAEHKHMRTIIMVVLTIFCIVPLGMLRNVDSLSVLCTASIGFYVCLMLKIVFESEAHIIANDWTSKVLYWEPAGILQCLPIFSMALSCQMQLFEVFESINNQSLEKLNAIVRNATWICTVVYITVGFFGYVAFCTHTFSGNILVNLTPSFGSDIIKIGFVLSIAFSFPLVIFPCRASINSLLYRKGHSEATNYIPEHRFRAITIFIVGFSLCVALVIPSVELIIGLVGSTIGVAICIMFPASSFRKIIKKDSTERTLAQFILVSGFCLMILGTYANLNAIDEKSSGAQFNIGQVATPVQRMDQMPALDSQIQNSELLKHLAKQPEELKGIKQVEADQSNGRKNGKQVNLLKDSSDSPPLPPLPVDESHANTGDKDIIIEKAKIENEKPKAIETDQLSPVHNNKLSTDKPMAPGKLVNMTESPALQTIDRAAIKINDEVAAEEQKESKSNADELRKTQNELKKTKELLERTVDELKEELAKQNEETQNMVVRKLDKVAEKVDQIERRVQRENSLQDKVPVINKSATPAPKLKASLVELLTESAHAREEEEAHAAVFEPLSYKTGELLKNVNAVSPVLAAQRLPLPLLLRNGTQIQKNESRIAEQVIKATDLLNQPIVVNKTIETKPQESSHVKAEEQATPSPELLGRLKRETVENCLPEEDGHAD